MKYGRIVAANDEWTLSDAGFTNAPDASVFATNIASWFTGGSAGRFLVYSRNFGLVGSSLHSALTGAGHEVTTMGEFAGPFTAENLAGYAGVFLAGDAADNQVLIEYVKNGGCVYVAGGTNQAGGAAAESAMWATFLNHFDLDYASEFNHMSGNQTLSSDEVVFNGVSSLYQAGGNNLSLTDENSRISRVVKDAKGRGLYAVTDLSAAVGKIVTANDEWTLSDTGFSKASDAGVFAANVASWFAGGRAGRFLIYSNNFGLTQSRLHAALTEGGHTLVSKGDFGKPFTLENLAGFDGVFLAGDSADNQVLIEYVKSGGSVYLAAGTGAGGAAGEAGRWATFLGHFDLAFADVYNQIQGNQAIASDHPVFRNVDALYENNGNTIALTRESDISELITDAKGRGLYALTSLAYAG